MNSDKSQYVVAGMAAVILIETTVALTYFLLKTL